MRVPTSVILRPAARRAERPRDPGWIIDHLGARSFGIIMLIIALVGLVPGASPFIGILLAVPAIQMMMARPAPVLPRIIAGRKISTPRFVRLLHRVIPILSAWSALFVTLAHAVRSNEASVGSRHSASGCNTSCAASLRHIIPAVVVMLLAFAFLEEDGVLLCIALAAAVISSRLPSRPFGASKGALLL